MEDFKNLTTSEIRGHIESLDIICQYYSDKMTPDYDRIIKPEHKEAMDRFKVNERLKIKLIHELEARVVEEINEKSKKKVTRVKTVKNAKKTVKKN